MLSRTTHALYIETSLQTIKVNIEQKSAKTVRKKKSAEYQFFALFIGGLASGHIHPPPPDDIALHDVSVTTSMLCIMCITLKNTKKKSPNWYQSLILVCKQYRRPVIH
jgi:hypothetical protein